MVQIVPNNDQGCETGQTPWRTVSDTINNSGRTALPSTSDSLLRKLRATEQAPLNVSAADHRPSVVDSVEPTGLVKRRTADQLPRNHPF